ncbi:MAG TPA: hypothetical protein VJL60_05110 [Gammaproteobacteria bacterium]|nr:hypothetical protein [Gammaproteobacteria bacterium]
MIGHRHEIARLQSDMYRDRYHKIVRALIVSAGIILLLIAGIIYSLLDVAPPQYYGTTTDGRIIPMTVVK